MDDCIIIGAGPAGLTAAIYLARFHLSIRLFDCGSSRAASIPCTRNHAGYPDGIAGADLLGLMLAQAERYGAVREQARVTGLEHDEKGFVAVIGDRRVYARTVLLATGVINHRPAMDERAHGDALARGLLRYCPICDGYEVTDKRVGVIGKGSKGLAEAKFLRGYTRDLTLIWPDADCELDQAALNELVTMGVVLAGGPCGNLRIDGDAIMVPTPAGDLAFDSVYPALGSDIRSELAVMVGADVGADGCLGVDAHQRTTVPGLYAAGDVVIGLDQISHAMGAAGVAAVTIRNDLADRAPLLR